MDSIVDSPSSFKVLTIEPATFRDAYRQFRRFHDQEISFVDHTSSVLATGRYVDHMFTFDTNDFRTLRFTCVPDDVTETKP